MLPIAGIFIVVAIVLLWLIRKWCMDQHLRSQSGASATFRRTQSRNNSDGWQVDLQVPSRRPQPTAPLQQRPVMTATTIPNMPWESPYPDYGAGWFGQSPLPKGHPGFPPPPPFSPYDTHSHPAEPPPSYEESINNCSGGSSSSNNNNPPRRESAATGTMI